MEQDKKITALQWMLSGDTGVSSETLLAAAYGMRPRNPGAPADVDDFGRCYRLWQNVELVAERMSRVAEACPLWAPYVERWEDMCRAYALAMASSPGTEERQRGFLAVQKLLDAADAHARAETILARPGPGMFKIEDRHMQQAIYHLRLAMQPEVPYRPDGDARMLKDAYAIVQREINLAYAHLFEAAPGWMSKHGQEPAAKE